MKNQYGSYFSALTRYEEEANRLLEEPRRNISVTRDIIECAKQKNIPIQQDETLIEHLADSENRVPSQLYAVIGEILRLIKNIEEK
ncbi:flagellar biosynthesis protein FlhB [Anoxybacteroides tepidamans]|uniref:flagellar biosynthesis protein FlhB n=1 Tax=Anoxybacteroides tepidamans TaxID=265948 RepID=UPI00048236A9|nr:flagellar biosynthesis protein FlhB [Anoxybacillus tepidamans]